MKKKFLTIGLPILGGLLVAGVGIASAAGMFVGGGAAVSPATWAANQATTFQNEATALGLSESVVVAGWAQGQSLMQIATANGISAATYRTDMQAYAKSQQQADLAALVSQGTITSAQETSYLAALATQQAAIQAKMQGGGFDKGMRGRKATSTPATS